MSEEKYILEKVETEAAVEDIYRIFKDRPYSVILDSSLYNEAYGTYSIIVFEPFLVFESRRNEIKVASEREIRNICQDPFEYLRSLLNLYRCERLVPDIPFISGCVGFFSYDLCRMIENVPERARDEYSIPDIMLGFYNNAVIIDHRNKGIYISAASAGMNTSAGIETALKNKVEKIKRLIEENGKRTCGNGTCINERLIPQPVRADFTREEYCNTVEKAREYIKNGDIFQVNLSQRFKTRIVGEPYEIFEKLRNINPAPFSAYINFEDLKVISSSPERFIKVQDDMVETRPIKGTRPRGETREADIKLKNELLNSEKDMAELTMIVDLERNDLGKVCKIGTVEVERLFEIEEYASVFHLVSTVRGRLKDDVNIIDIIKAAFPGGSITGAPKIRAMEIIDELEPVKRGVYTGAVGYIDFNGSSDLNIAIRTITVKDGEAFYNVGGGIVWDSVPEKEYQETLDKGKALKKAMESG